MKEIPTWLPVFPGFYNTLFEPDSDLGESVDQGKKDGYFPESYLWYDGDNFDDCEYQLKVARIAVESIFKMLPAEMGIEALKFEEIQSPKEYNFQNDSINIIAHVNLERFTAFIREYIKENEGVWNAYLSRYKSRDGFISSYPHTPDQWEVLTDNYTNFETEITRFGSRAGKHALGALVDFYLRVENEDVELSLYYKVSQGVSPSEFLKIKA